MRTFEDATGTEWDVNITLLTEADIHDAAGVYLSDLSPERNILEDLATDPVLFSKVLAVVCNKQLRERDISSRGLLENLYGEYLDNARDAVIEATFDFLGRRGETLREMRDEQIRIDKELMEKSLDNLRKTTGEDMAQMMLETSKINDALEQIIDTDGMSVEDLELTPEDLPSDSLL